MIPGRTKPYKPKHFRAGLICGVIGCTRKARHQWAYPCSIRTMTTNPEVLAWLPVCDECDIVLNSSLLTAVGTPEHIRTDLLSAYRLIQADGAYDNLKEIK